MDRCGREDILRPQRRHGWQGPQGLGWTLSRFCVSIASYSYKKQPVKKNWGKILGLAWLKFAVAALVVVAIGAKPVKACL